MLGSGRHALSLLNRPCAAAVLARLADGGGSTKELIETVPGLRRTAVDSYLESLARAGALTSRPRPRAGRTLDRSLTEYGQGLSLLAELIKLWLARHPGGPVRFSEPVAQRVIGSRAEGWGSQILWAAERKPASRGAIAARIADIKGAESWGLGTEDSIRNRVSWMIETSQLVHVGGSARPALFAPSLWARSGTGCLAYAIWLELSQRPPGSTGPSPRTVALCLIQAANLLQVSTDLAGTVALTMRLERDSEPIRLVLDLERGRAADWRFSLTEAVDAELDGTVRSWLADLTREGTGGPVWRGDPELCKGAKHGVKRALFGQ